MVIGQLSQRLAGGGLAGLPLPGVLSRAQRAAGCLRGMAVSIMSANAVAVLHALAARDEDVADPHLAPDLWPLGPFTVRAHSLRLLCGGYDHPVCRCTPSGVTGTAVGPAGPRSM